MTDFSRRQTFSDDTTTGERSLLRGTNRVTVVARAEDSDNFEWLASLAHAFLPEGAEPKSKNLLPLVELNDAACRLLHRRIQGYAIIIVDLQAHRRQIAKGLLDRLSHLVPNGLDPETFMLDLMKHGSNGRELMRQMLVSESVVGRVENLMEWSANPLSDSLEKAGFADFAQRPSVQLLPPTELSAMRESHLALLLARLGAAIADALSAERQAQLLQDAMDAQRIFVPGYYASKLLAMDIETDRIFDDGPAPVMHRLEEANYSIRSYVEARQTHAMSERVKAGLFEERSSHGQLGLQAADIAAAIATREYELAPPDSTGSRVHGVTRHFASVFFNGHWV